MYIRLFMALFNCRVQGRVPSKFMISTSAYYIRNWRKKVDVTSSWWMILSSGIVLSIGYAFNPRCLFFLCSFTAFCWISLFLFVLCIDYFNACYKASFTRIMKFLDRHGISRVSHGISRVSRIISRQDFELCPSNYNPRRPKMLLKIMETKYIL